MFCSKFGYQTCQEFLEKNHSTFKLETRSQQTRPNRMPINLFRDMRWKDLKYQISQALNHQVKDKIYCSLLIDPSFTKRATPKGFSSMTFERSKLKTLNFP